MEHVIFVWDGPPMNYVKVCLESLRLHNDTCVIHFYHDNDDVVKCYSQFNVCFRRINENNPHKFKFGAYKIFIAGILSVELTENDKVLVLDCDLLFQNDPFSMFTETEGDFYYSHNIMSTKDSQREEKLWKSVDYKVNGGVWGFIVNDSSKQLLKFWTNNILRPSWKKWINYASNTTSGKVGPKRRSNLKDYYLMVDQDFMNCIDNNLDDLPFQLRVARVSYRYNYFTSTWGFFNKNLEMGGKIGDGSYVIIHFKANFKDTYNVNNSKIYNIENVTKGKKLVTPESYDRIHKKFLGRGSRRFHIV